MLYPNFLKPHSTIGITAPSDGRTDPLDLIRLDNAYKNLHNRGYNTIETPNTRTSSNGRSSTPTTRVKELHSLYLNKDISLIISASGGDFMYEILPLLDFNIIKQNPKWLQGYSDNTNLTFTITTNLDIATIYGDNIAAFGMNTYHKSLLDNLAILEGKKLEQSSFPKYQNTFPTYKTGLESYNLDTDTNWINLFAEKDLSLQGRLIGGCLDVLITLIGTKYDKTQEFIQKYKSDGIIWYLENCDLNNEQISRALFQLESAGWFQNTTGIIFGRTLTDKSNYNISYQETIKQALEHLEIPVIIEADFGHKSPRMTIINGSYATIKSSNGQGTISYQLK